MSSTRFVDLWDDLLADGEVSLTLADVVEQSGSTYGAAKVAVAEAQRRNRLFSPARGLYVLVPAEHRAAGAVPVDWYIDDLCRHLGRSYYIGYLSASARHGASHQAAQVSQVVVDRAVAGRETGRGALVFYADKHVSIRSTLRMTSPTGRVEVATPETCAYDLAAHPDRGGGLSNTATVLRELPLDTDKLVEQAGDRPGAVIRRLGYLLDLVGAGVDDLLPLAKSRQRATPLDPRSGHLGEVDRQWQILVNTTVEPDL